MRKITLCYLVFLIVVLVLFSVSIAASMQIPANDQAKERAKAPEKSPVISENWDLERIDFIHYVKPVAPSAGKAPSCYKLLGVKWTTLPVNYVINPGNPQGLSESFVTSVISVSAETWDAATLSELVNNAYSIDYNAQYGVQNFENALAFGEYPDSRVIAVTSIWFTRVGKKIVEFDILFNTRYNWGDAAVDQSRMDLQNIATHEFGHGFGLNDIYDSACSAVTMYGYSDYSETSKRTLEQPDITGLQKMYGA